MAINSEADENDLKAWAATKPAQQEFPSLIRKLVAYTAKENVTLLYSPSGDGTSKHGYDGIVRSSGEYSFIPDGDSVWEYSCEEGIVKKLNYDYKKRVQKHKDDNTLTEAKNITYIAATPRRWTSKQITRKKWVEDRNKEGIWKEVIALDLDDILSWLDICKPVHCWLSDLLGVGLEGLTSSDRFWEQNIHRSSIEITPSFFLMGRGDVIEELNSIFLRDESKIHIRCNSKIDLYMFLCALAVMPSASDEINLSARLYFVSDERTMHKLNRLYENLIIVPLNDEVEAVAYAGDHTLIISELVGENFDFEIPDFTKENVAEFLTESEIVTEQNSTLLDKIVKNAHRGFEYMLPLLLRKGELIQPKISRTKFKNITKLLLSGGWEESDADIKIIEEFTHDSYPDLQSEIKDLMKEETSMLKYQGSTIRWVDRDYAWELLSPEITKFDLVEFEKLFDSVFVTHIEVNSELFKEGILDSVCRLSQSSDREYVTISEKLAIKIIRILADDEVGDSWVEYSKFLHFLAETLPESFIEAASKCNKKQSRPIKILFSSGAYVELLSSLEKISWSQTNFSRSVLLLAELADIETQSGYVNAPLSSLIDIFSPIMVNTNKKCQQLLDVIDLLRNKTPLIAKEIMKSILEKQISTQAIFKPKYFKHEKPTTFDQNEYSDFVNSVEERLLNDTFADDGESKNEKK